MNDAILLIKFLNTCTCASVSIGDGLEIAIVRARFGETQNYGVVSLKSIFLVGRAAAASLLFHTPQSVETRNSQRLLVRKLIFALEENRIN
jgi:hypothetical protein